MCLVSSPKVDTSSSTSNQPLAILRNPYLDGTNAVNRANQTGLNALRIDRGPPAGITAPGAQAAPTISRGPTTFKDIVNFGITKVAPAVMNGLP